MYNKGVFLLCVDVCVAALHHHPNHRGRRGGREGTPGAAVAVPSPTPPPGYDDAPHTTQPKRRRSRAPLASPHNHTNPRIRNQDPPRQNHPGPETEEGSLLCTQYRCSLLNRAFYGHQNVKQRRAYNSALYSKRIKTAEKDGNNFVKKRKLTLLVRIIEKVLIGISGLGYILHKNKSSLAFENLFPPSTEMNVKSARGHENNKIITIIA